MKINEYFTTSPRFTKLTTGCLRVRNWIECRETHTHTHIYKYKNQIWLIHRFIIWHLASVIPSQDIIKYNFHGFTFGLVQIAKTLIDLRKNEQFFVFFCSQIHLSQFNSQIFITTWISTEYCYRTLIQRRKYRSHSNYLSTNVYNVYP